MATLLSRIVRLRFLWALLRNPRGNWAVLLLTLAGWLVNRNRRRR